MSGTGRQVLVRGRTRRDPLRPRTGQGAGHFQYNPGSARHADMHWGHFRSKDLLDWELLPMALSPTPEGDDADGVWTGNAVEAGGELVAFYSALRAGRWYQPIVRAGGHPCPARPLRRRGVHGRGAGSHAASLSGRWRTVAPAGNDVRYCAGPLRGRGMGPPGSPHPRPAAGAGADVMTALVRGGT
ncbi:hypothetical protein [Streptomyces sp. NPDC006274]|uniref:hypothetical protein n=1 Tax=unclassified Streptomyces TaxID=2593676 RepID=UPI0033AAED7B